jgi:ketosteroid isomerase-like protein
VKAQQSATVEPLKRIVSAFHAHELDAVMNSFADDCELMAPRGPEMVDANPKVNQTQLRGMERVTILFRRNWIGY